MKKDYRHSLVEDFANRWEKEEKDYEELEQIVLSFLKDKINVTETLPTIASRVKSLNSLIKTAIKKDKKYYQVSDKLGIRIVCRFKSELKRINNFIEDNFIVKEFESKEKKLKENEFGYLSDHFIVKVNENKLQQSIKRKLLKLNFEIQVRTLCQHAWADVQHDIIYKEDISLEKTTKRKMYRIASLLEISDDEFDKVNNDLLDNERYIPLLIGTCQ